MNDIQLILGDCLEKFKEIPDKSVDLIICDLPYGTTKCSWDSIIPFEDLWREWHRVSRDIHTPIVLFGVMPLFAKCGIQIKKNIGMNGYGRKVEVVVR